MDLDDHTLHTFRALQETPQGQQPGEVFEATAAAGDVLVRIGAAERVEPESEPASKGKTKGKYRRRDLVADDQ
jgi:hypothetical protein